MAIKILDCTLRDGGYYNNWFFDQSMVNQYLLAMQEASIDYVELGFRNPIAKGLGPYAYTSDKFLDGLSLPKGPEYGVMIDAKDYLKDGINLDGYFLDCKDSKINLIRIAVNFDNFVTCEDMTKKLKSLGYKVGLNLMQSHGKSEKEYIDAGKEIRNWDAVDVLYFADSLGNMSYQEVESITKYIESGWNGAIGIHTHNNKGFALNNSVAAIESGVTWCDGTVTGMGRGAGNVPTENLIMELQNLGKFTGDPLKLHATTTEFSKLKEVYNWGPNLHYHYAANQNIHPTFVQTLLSDDRYEEIQIIDSLKYLSKVTSTSFNEEYLKESIFSGEDLSGSWDATGWLANQEVLMIGGGPSVVKNKGMIEKFIKEKKCKVVFLNHNSIFSEELAIATIVSNQSRVVFEAQLYKDIKHPIIMPYARFKNILAKELEGLEIYDYGLTLRKDTFEIQDKGCILDSCLAAAYALALLTKASASSIILAGFDGYSLEDIRHDEMEQILKNYKSAENSKPIRSLTETSYSVKSYY